MNILAIETSCDETGVALLRISGGARAPKAVVLDNLVASQIKIHQPFGGVVPNLAKREHLKNLPILFKKLQSRHKPLKFDLITVTVGPGLEPALWTGITFAQALAKEYKKPLVGANHLEGHLYSFLLLENADARVGSSAAAAKKKIAFPAVALIVSGGHTLLLKMDSFSQWQHLGETRDDAAGEAFDKVARMLKLPYPGGPEIQKVAAQGDPAAIAFPRPMLHEKNYDFSFSGLKTSVLYYLRDHTESAVAADVAASFQQAAVDVLVAKTIRAVRDAGAKSVILCGGVAANKKLRSDLGKAVRKNGARFFVPPFKYNLDNGAMIGLAGYMANERNKRYKMEADGTLGV